MLSNYDRGQLLKSAMDHPSFEGTYEMMVALVKALKYSAWHANFLRPLGLLLDGEEDNVQEPEQALDDGRVAAEIKEGEVANDVEAEVKDATDQQMEIQEVRPLDPHALLTAIRRTHKDAANGVWIRDESSGKGEGGGRIKKSPLQGKKGKVEGSASTSTAAKAHEVQDALKLGIALLEGTQSFVLSKPLNKVADRERYSPQIFHLRMKLDSICPPMFAVVWAAYFRSLASAHRFTNTHIDSRTRNERTHTH
jgi:hypothetical protein